MRLSKWGQLAIGVLGVLTVVVVATTGTAAVAKTATPAQANASTTTQASVPVAALAGSSTNTPKAGLADATQPALTCPAGYLCVYTNSDWTGSVCMWQNADNDWYSGTAACAWASTVPVKSFRNAGTSTSYTGVTLYSSANYVNPWFCAPQRTSYTIGGNGVLLRSHKWVRTSCPG